MLRVTTEEIYNVFTARFFSFSFSLAHVCIHGITVDDGKKEDLQTLSSSRKAYLPSVSLRS